MTTNRRGANHTGTSHYRAKEGRWEWKITLPDGTRKSFYGKTETAARSRANTAVRDMERGVDLSVKDLTVSAFLTTWLEETASDRVRPSTLVSYTSHVDIHINPSFGRVKLRNLTPQHVNRMMADMISKGASPATANRVRATIRTALTSAVKWGYVSQNVASLADARREKKMRIKPLELEQVRALLDYTRDHKYGPLFSVAVATGLRQGEILALRWDTDVDLDAGLIRVHHTLGKDRLLADPKTEHSRRTLHLTSSAIAALKRQQRLNEQNEIAAAGRWNEQGIVFPTSIGTYLDGPTVNKELQAILEQMKLPKQRFHDLRHCTASLLLAEGLDLFTVKEILGHSQISLTANTYGHLTRKSSEDAADRLGRALAED